MHTKTEHHMSSRWRRRFDEAVLVAIITNTVVLVSGLIVHEEWLETCDVAFLWFFVTELGVRLADVDFNPRRFFAESWWNGFDAVVIALALLPAVGVGVTLLRVARLARIVHGLRHVSHLRLAAAARIARMRR